MKKRLPERQESEVSSQKVEGGGERAEKDQQKIADVREMIRDAAVRTLEPEEKREIEEALELFSGRIQVAACETPDDFRALFRLHGISDLESLSSNWLLKNGCFHLYKGIKKDSRFSDNDWSYFQDFLTPSPDCPAVNFSSLSDLPVANEDGRLTLDRIYYVTIGSFSVLHSLNKKTVSKRIRKLISIKGKTRIGRIRDFYVEDECIKVCHDLLCPQNLDQISNDGFLLRDGIRYATRAHWADLKDLHRSVFNQLIDGQPSIQGRDHTGRITLLFAENTVNQVLDSRQLLPRVDNNGFCIVKTVLYGTQAGWRKKYPDIILPNRMFAKINFIDGININGVPCHLYPENDILDYVNTHANLPHSIADGSITIDGHIYRTIGNYSQRLGYDFKKLSLLVSSLPFIVVFTSNGRIANFYDENIVKKLFLSEQDSFDEIISPLHLEEAEALLGHDPSKFKLYIQMSHPELAEEEVNSIVIRSFKRLSTRKSFEYTGFEHVLDPCIFDEEMPAETEESTLLLTGVARGADSVMVSSSRSTRRVRTASDGTFQVRIPLVIGERNAIDVYSVNHAERTLGEVSSFSVLQTSTQDDIQHLIDLLGTMGAETLRDIRSNAGRMEYVVRQTERVLIRKFSKNFEEGRNYIDHCIASTKSPVVRKILQKVLDHFRRIDRTKYPDVRKESPLYFFQKYSVAYIQASIARGDPGMILANAPGLGKTRTALVAVNGDPTTIIAPNSVVSAWGEEADKCLVDSSILTLQNIPRSRRIRLLQDHTATHVVTNIEFLRGKEDDPRYALLADKNTIIIQDEAHGLANLASEQSKGARRLNGKFKLFLSATPFRDPKMMRRMLHHLHPNDQRFSSDKAFSQAFPSGNPQALRTLSILKEQYVLRFRKEDVLEEMDPSLPIADQLHCLPRKEYIPSEQYGACTMSEAQANAIYELFLDWSQWCQKYDRYIPTDSIAMMDHLRKNQYSFAKIHALRQIANNPDYIGHSDIEDGKTKEMKRVIDACLAEGRKVVIFCQYNAQSQKYADLLSSYSPSVYTGVTSQEGLKKSPSGHPLLYKKHENGGWEFDQNGYPLEDTFGMPMLAMDYERLVFQNVPERKIMIATYSAGAVGVTFTAGKAVIFDDLPRDCIEEIQAEDRTHRIDLEHQTHHSVKYIRMMSRYPQAFLERMKKTFVWMNDDGTYNQTTSRSFAKKHDYQTAYDLFFAQGTYDEWKLENLLMQRRMFQLINDGIADESILEEGQKEFLVSLDDS